MWWRRRRRRWWWWCFCGCVFGSQLIIVTRCNPLIQLINVRGAALLSIPTSNLRHADGDVQLNGWGTQPLSVRVFNMLLLSTGPKQSNNFHLYCVVHRSADRLPLLPTPPLNPLAPPKPSSSLCTPDRLSRDRRCARCSRSVSQSVSQSGPPCYWTCCRSLLAIMLMNIIIRRSVRWDSRRSSRRRASPSCRSEGGQAGASSCVTARQRK